MYHMFGQAVAMGACALLEACLIYVSCQGSILETESRRAIPALVGIRSSESFDVCCLLSILTFLFLQ